jgi:Protein of unknown function (DUF3107)
VEIKIGIQSVPRELILETNSSADEVAAALEDAVAKRAVFTLLDHKGGRVLIPADKIAYVEFSANEQRRVGFGNVTGPSI